MVLRSAILALAAIMTFAVTALTPISASAGGIRNGGHGIIVVCHKGR
jgi:hypothetical protein